MLILSRFLLVFLIISAIFWICINLIGMVVIGPTVLLIIRIIVAGAIVYFAYNDWEDIDACIKKA